MKKVSIYRNLLLQPWNTVTWLGKILFSMCWRMGDGEETIALTPMLIIPTLEQALVLHLKQKPVFSIWPGQLEKEMIPN